MNTPITSKFFLSALLVGTHLMQGIPTDKHHITAIVNKSGEPAEINGNHHAYLVNKATRERLEWPMLIPFISINQYRDQFIAGEPYFPQKALIVTTSQGKYALWRDETGIMCALEYVPGKLREECVPVSLFKHNNKEVSQNIIKSIMFLLSINKQGELTLIHQN